MSDAGTPELHDLILEGVASAFLNLYVASVGIVQSYDDARQTCAVLPAIRRPLPVGDGTYETVALPIVENVPVMVFGSPKLSVQCELAKGDTVLLVYLDYSPAAWRKSGTVSDPHDTRGNGPSYPVAIPWFRPSGAAGPDEQNTAGASEGVRVKFTSATVEVGDGSDFVAMAAKVDSRLSALEAFAASHTHPVPGVTPGPGATTSSPAPGAPTGASTASSTLKAD